MAGTSSPTVRRRELGALLRSFRTGAGLTVEQVAAELLCSPSKVSRLETGHRGASPRDVRDLCNLYGVTDPAERDRLMALAREGKQQAWWHHYDLRYQTYVGLEDEASSIRLYSASVVPALLQTADYSRAATLAVVPDRSAQAVAQEVDARLTRQQVLNRADPPEVVLVLDEAVLHRMVGSPAVTQAQLEHLRQVSRRPNVTVHVVPYVAGAPPTVETKFNILGFSGQTLPDVVFIEGLVGDLYLERVADVQEYHKIFGLLLKMALAPPESYDFITKIITSSAA
jgi:transcriptional regulator with XRE-family HTH domain